MKKNAIILTMLLAFSLVHQSYGQDSLKASYRNFLTELNVNPFQGQISLNNALNQIKFRYMRSETTALRLGFTVNSKKSVNNVESVYGTSPSKDNATGTSTMIGINFGIEKHFAGTQRLSPYIGCELSLGYKWSKYVDETNSQTTTTTGTWPQYQTIQNPNGSYSYVNLSTERGYFSYGLNIITGFDFYMAKHFFIGYEVAFGFTRKKYSDIDVTYGPNGSTSNSTAPDYDTREFSFGPSIINGIRIGYVF